MATAVVVASTVMTTAVPAGGETCVLEPVLRDFNINQGLPYKSNATGTEQTAYDPLTARRETLVRLYLSLPECATGTGASVQVKKTTTTLSVGGVLGTTYSPLNVATGDLLPGIVGHSQAPAAVSGGDPFFGIPAADVGAGLVTFEATVDYVFTPSGGTLQDPSGSTKTFSGTAVFSSTDPLSVLFVPMGDARVEASPTPQFSASAHANLAAAISAVSRMMPVAGGVDALNAPATSTAGIRRSVSPAMLDIGPAGLNLMVKPSPSQPLKFCGNGTNYAPVQAGLDALLQKWNTDNPGTKADRAIGVLDPAIATVGGSCFFGLATLPGEEAWFVATDGNAGALLMMELAHTWGLAQHSGGHSSNTEADLAAPNRGYNVSLRRQLGSDLGADRSALRFSDSNWNNVQTLLEAPDWRYTDCALGGLSTTCVGSDTAFTGLAGAGSRIVAAGSANRSSGKLEVDDSYLTDNEEATEPATAGRWYAVQVDAGGVEIEGTDASIPIRFEHADHDEGPDAPPAVGSFRISHDVDPQASRFQIRDREDGDIEFDRVIDHTNESPTITGADAGQPAVQMTTNYTSSPAADDRAPALSSTGLIAWSEAGRVVVASLDDKSKRVTVPDSAANPTWSRDGTELAYEAPGGHIDIREVAIDSNGIPDVGIERERVYDATLDSALTAAHHPSFGPDPERLVMEARDDLFIIDRDPGDPGDPVGCLLAGVTSGSCIQLTSTPVQQEAEPTWAPAGQRIAFTFGNQIRVIDGVGLCNSAPCGAHVVDGTEPSWGTEHRLAFARSGDIRVVDPASKSEVGISTGGNDSGPAVHPTEGTIAFERDDPLLGNAAHDVWIASTSAAPGPVLITITATDDSQDLEAELRAQIGIDCDGAVYPVVAGLTGELVGDEMHFTHLWNPDAFPTVPCAGGTFVYAVNDGAKSDHQQGEGTGTADAEPVVRIEHPTPGTSFRSGTAVMLSAVASDAEGPLAGRAWEVTTPTGVVTDSGSDDFYFVPAGVGHYEATITVTDASGQSASASTTFDVVADNPPVPQVTSPAEGQTFSLGSTVNVAGSASDPEDGSVPPERLDWAVVDPNGTTKRFAKTDQFAVAVNVGGPWLVSLTATDSHGNTVTVARTFRVADVASVDYDPDSINVPPLPTDSPNLMVLVKIPGRDLTQINPGTVRFTAIVTEKSGTFDVSNEPWAKVTQWAVKGKFGVDQHAKGVVDRIALSNYLGTRPGWVENQFLTITIVGATADSSWSFLGSDRIFAKKAS